MFSGAAMTHSGITAWLVDWQRGEADALSRIVPAVYEDLRRAAALCLRREWRSRNPTLQSTALVHEAYAVVAGRAPFRCKDGRHFLAILRRLMEQILIQHARRRNAAKRGGSDERVTFDEGLMIHDDRPRAQELDVALDHLRRSRPRTHLVIEMHYRGGYSVPEIAATIGISPRSVERELESGRNWIERQMPGA
jgi:RNA polymerase sigma factor (TIGR02999 family)